LPPATPFIGHDETITPDSGFPLVRAPFPSQHPRTLASEELSDEAFSASSDGVDSVAFASTDVPALVSDISPAPTRAMISAAELRVLLAQPDTQQRIRAIVAKRVRKGAPGAVRDDIVQQANLTLLQSPSRPRSAATASGWVSAVTHRQVANYFRARAVETRWLEIDEDPEARPEAAQTGPDAAPEGDWMIAPWLAQAVASSPRDQETFELLVYKAATRKTYEEVADDHAMAPKALVGRVVQFKKKYLPRYQRRRTNVALAVLTGALTLALLGWLFWYPKPEVAKPPPPKPAPSATSSAVAPPVPIAPQPPEPAPVPTDLDLKR
jgi:DNA-directed RNA polymerase specialized sigma24 family protein